VNRFLIIVFLAIQFSVLTAQTTSIESLEVCAAQEVLIPVMASNLSNVGALTLYVGFDTINLNYLSVENIDPQIQGLTINLMTNPTQLAFAWSNTSPVNFVNDKLFDLKFYANGNNSQVFFNNGCEISDTGGIVVSVTYIDGAVTSGLPVVITNPTDTTIMEGYQASFYVGFENTLFFSWRESQDNGTSWITLDDNERYGGTKTNQLKVYNTPLTFNGFRYQCMLSTNMCQVISEDAVLTVDESTSAVSTLKTNQADIVLAPVPCKNNLDVTINNLPPSNAVVYVFDADGRIVKRISFRNNNTGTQYINLLTDDLSSGNYCLVAVCENGYVVSKPFIK
jgi:hypothetical protein